VEIFSQSLIQQKKCGLCIAQTKQNKTKQNKTNIAMKKIPFAKKKASAPSSDEDNNDAFVARRSNHVTDSKFNQSDGDTWQETLAVCELNDKLGIRSYYTNRRTDQRVWDEPPSGASNINEASEEMREMAKVQLSEMKIVTGQVEDPDEVKKKVGIGGLFRRKKKDNLPIAARKSTTNKEGKKLRSRIQYKSDSFIAESKKFSSNENFQGHALQQALVASIAESTGRTNRTDHGETEHYNRFQDYHNPNDYDLELALALSLFDSQPQEETKEEEGLELPVPGSSQAIDRSKSPHRYGEEHSAHRPVRNESPHPLSGEPSMQHDVSKSLQQQAAQRSVHYRDQSKSPQQHAVERSTYGQHCVDSDLEMALALSLAEATKPTRLKDPPPSVPVTTIPNAATLPPLDDDQPEISDHYCFAKFPHTGRSLGDPHRSEDEGVAMALAVSTTDNNPPEIEDQKPAAKQNPILTTMKLTKNNTLETMDKKPTANDTPTPTSINHTQNNTTEIESKKPGSDCGQQSRSQPVLLSDNEIPGQSCQNTPALNILLKLLVSRQQVSSESTDGTSRNGATASLE
jgi:hypothetical protein